MEPGRAFHPPATSVTVQAIYDAQSIAVLLRWHDMSAEKTGKNGPSLPVPVEEEEEATPTAPEGAAAAGNPGEAAFSGGTATPTDMTEIYDSAQIGVPAHGYTVLKVAEMLHSEHIRALPADVKQKSIMVALDAAGVKIADIVEDAVKRDRALDTYERVLLKHLEELRTQKAAENQRLEEEINQRVAELKARVDQNNADLGAEQNNLRAWRVRKRQEHDQARPLLNGGDMRATLEKISTEREPIYALADMMLESGDEPHAVLVDKIVAALAAHGICECP
jgi:hypothetical protein